MTKRIYGWRPQLPDHRDYQFDAVRERKPLPASADLASGFQPVYDQGQRGSCTGNGVVGVLTYGIRKEGLANVQLSRRFAYINALIAEGSFPQDAGAAIRDVVKLAAKFGVCFESLFPYGAKKFFTKPSKKAFTDALANRIESYLAVTPTLEELKGCLADGFPFVFGISVYESFESQAVADTGLVPMPSKSEKDLGGHCIIGAGYDDATQRFKIRNSWGTGWGDGGYCYLPYEYLTNKNLASDFWTVRTVS